MITAAPTFAPTAVSQVASTQHIKFSDSTFGISFDYPSNWSILPHAPDEAQGMTLHGPGLGAGPEPIIFAVTIDVQPVAETSVSDIVDEQMTQVPSDLKGGIRFRPLTVGGEPATEVIGLPSLGGAVETFVLHKSQLYLVILQPYDESNASLTPYLPQARSEYDIMIESWKFLR